ncbi:Threonylcarbamoyladenosine tRNA methylthiotransferase MtaB [Candidatus Bealeia paramacronuclearis]|uniref:Threonylcarbamoyladenosine tRNA methylthiotransferase MtaB n=1 Tax=Candidatus Bealeia paramacronuclearis TaxID=1921001 RepID=A0ABZ2C4K8_9PROT|nr:Threonylcarbamoyladenosine tRNA methylthiotransferase MtaB [Candidatus Bealeia paramacronuclearis]
MTNEIITFGCRLNSYESEVMREQALKVGLENAVIINTCAVTTEAERQARQTIRKIRRENPSVKIIVTGCAAQISPEKFAEMPEVDRVLGNHEKMHSHFFMPELEERVLVNDIMSIKETAEHLISGFDGKARAFIQVQNGCDHRCTFCTIPYGRGNSRSVPLGAIVGQVQKLVEEDYQEVVLTGVDITSYGPDLPGKPTLGQMMKRLLMQVPELPRLRLSSLDPVEIDEDLYRLISEEPRLMPHLHISLQAGHNMILKRMKRRHLREDAIAFVEKVRALRPDVTFGADLIAGFPTETEEMFQDTLRIVDDCDLAYLHVFPYSPRPGTPAAKMPQVQKADIKERARRLREKGEASLARNLERFSGKTLTVLMESETQGHSEHFAPVEILTPQKIGSLVHAVVQEATPTKLIAEVVA